MPGEKWRPLGVLKAFVDRIFGASRGRQRDRSTEMSVIVVERLDRNSHAVGVGGKG